MKIFSGVGLFFSFLAFLILTAMLFDVPGVAELSKSIGGLLSGNSSNQLINDSSFASKMLSTISEWEKAYFSLVKMLWFFVTIGIISHLMLFLNVNKK